MNDFAVTVKYRKHSGKLDSYSINTLRPRQHGRHFPDDIFRCIFLNENIWIAINISRSFVLKGLIDNIPALVQIMAWRRSGDKPLSEPMMVSLLMHICVTRPQWVKTFGISYWHFTLKYFLWVGHFYSKLILLLLRNSIITRVVYKFS